MNIWKSVGPKIRGLMLNEADGEDLEQDVYLRFLIKEKAGKLPEVVEENFVLKKAKLMSKDMYKPKQ